MIGALRGTVAEHLDRALLLDVHDVFYRVAVTPATLRQCTVDAMVTLFTHLHQREEAPELYGFVSEEERSLFALLISVSGVGPRGAMSILALAPVRELEQHIATGDAALLTKVSGIGKKTAERLVVELKEKLSDRLGGPAGESPSEVFDALQRLGYSAREAREAIRHIDRSGSVSDQVRAALKVMGK
ncbi:MAG: Holliday junction branch migration protein RuvA [Candidatus Kerfeldbacteria bacterium]|nr:Holliday junction branch migration protein RuvA [Candidatus Kerfeldbacteria bacterium]